MGYIIQAVGIEIILSAIWLRATQKLTANFTAFWGIFGILLCAAGAASPVSDWMNALNAGEKHVLFFSGAAILVGGFIASLSVSRLTLKNQELAIQLSLSLQENEEILAWLDEVNEKNSFCN